MTKHLSAALLLWAFLAVCLSMAEDVETNVDDFDEEDGALETNTNPNVQEVEMEPGEIQEMYPDKDIEPEQLADLFTMIDTDKDGKISVTDLISYGKKMRTLQAKRDTDALMEEMDTSGDKKLSFEEIMEEYDVHSMENMDKSGLQGAGAEAPDAPPMDKAFEALKFGAADKDKDGLLDKNEIPGYMLPEHDDEVQTLISKESLKQMDQNEDGKLSQEEIFPPEQAEQMEGAEMEEFDKVFKMHDMDKDGFLNVEELVNFESSWRKTEVALEELFKVSDENKDGQLTVDELTDALPTWEEDKDYYEAKFTIQEWFNLQEEKEKEEL